MKNIFRTMALVSFIVFTQTTSVMAKSKAQNFFDSLSATNMALVDSFYSETAVFIDPVGRHEGLPAIRSYYSHLYENVISIRFEYPSEIQNGNETVLLWKMFLKHKKLKGGDEVVVDGNSYMRLDPQSGKVVYQRDYFDMGEFLYENIPVLGSIIRKIKSMAAGS